MTQPGPVDLSHQGSGSKIVQMSERPGNPPLQRLWIGSVGQQGGMLPAA